MPLTRPSSILSHPPSLAYLPISLTAARFLHPAICTSCLDRMDPPPSHTDHRQTRHRRDLPTGRPVLHCLTSSLDAQWLAPACLSACGKCMDGQSHVEWRGKVWIGRRLKIERREVGPDATGLEWTKLGRMHFWVVACFCLALCGSSRGMERCGQVLLSLSASLYAIVDGHGVITSSWS
ncbi:hypothetical protein HDK77DRAFT_18283 [Phyllosticta capitalensis]|uniref:Uncharacterized protein n=1 Tax=Phyllosticta capitalensis TaxID=121624 RepID=A0ABR1YZ64_9PEZI